MSLEIVEILMERKRAGETIAQVDLAEHAINAPDFWDSEDAPELQWTTERNILGDDQQVATLPIDWRGFSFRFVGGGGMEHTYDDIGADTFEGWIAEITALADALLDAEIEKNRSGFAWETRADGSPDSVRFLSLWRFEVTEDYAGGIDHDYKLIGVIDPDLLENALWRGKRAEAIAA